LEWELERRRELKRRTMSVESDGSPKTRLVRNASDERKDVSRVAHDS